METKQEIKKYTASDFGKEEIIELRAYIDKHVPNHELNRLYTLSDNTEDKAIILIGIYRILKSCYSYASTQEIKDKLSYFLDKTKKSYEKILPLIKRYKDLEINYGKDDLIRKMSKIQCDNYEVIDELIDVFMVLGENIELMKTKAIIGVDMKKGDEDIKKMVEESRKIAKKEGA